MSERGIILTPEKVLDFLGGATQMRVPVKPQPNASVTKFSRGEDGTWCFWPDDVRRWKCPFGAPGDVVWGKETFTVYRYETDPCAVEPYVSYRADGATRGCGRFRIRELVGGNKHLPVIKSVIAAEPYKWRPSTNMPRWASRIVRTVKRVWVEQTEGIREWCAEFEEKP